MTHIPQALDAFGFLMILSCVGTVGFFNDSNKLSLMLTVQFILGTIILCIGIAL
jgi:hypothetical protein